MGEGFDVTDIPPGTVLMDKYRVVRTIGRGGRGGGSAADHLTLHARVAIKFLVPNLVSNEQIVKRFINEARAATRIRSDHVANVIDVGTMHQEGMPEEGLPYMVMEYLEGQDLGEWVQQGKKFPVEEAIHCIAQASEALAQAHKVGIIHRDIKPANLFQAELGEGRTRIKVLDFGISKIMDEETHGDMGLTKTTTVLGSGLYMSPEQMRSAKKVDFRTDIYSLGVCLYELLSGTQPFTAETFSELCVKVNIDPPTPLREHRPDISEELAEVIARAYARNPDDRFQTVQELVAALAPFIAGAASEAIRNVQGVTATERPPYMSVPPPPPVALAGTAAALTASAHPTPRKPMSMGVVVTLAAASLVAISAAGVFMLRSTGPLKETTTPTKAATTSADYASTLSTTAAIAGSTSAEASTSSTPATSVSDSAPATTTTRRVNTTPTTSRTPTTGVLRTTTTKPKTTTRTTKSTRCRVMGPHGLMIPCELAGKTP